MFDEVAAFASGSGADAPGPPHRVRLVPAPGVRKGVALAVRTPWMRVQRGGVALDQIREAAIEARVEYEEQRRRGDADG
ncbi:hypothetical protein [Streptomyces sp. NPDC001970]